MTSLVVIPQAPKPILPPKQIQLFCDDDYAEDRIEIYTDNAFFVVEHHTDVEKEPIELDGFSYERGHYTSSNGNKYYATTDIKSVKLLIADGVESQCIKTQLPSHVIDSIKSMIESLAEKYAKDGDDEKLA